MQITKKRGIIKSLFSVVLAVVIFAGIIPVAPVKSQETAAAEDYHTWRQMDPRWGNVSMGGNTVAKVGCLITSISMMAMASDSLDDEALANLGIISADDFNPGVLASAYSNRGGFTYGGGIASWGMLHQIIPQIDFVTDSNFRSFSQEGIAAEIKEMMDQGLHVIVNVNWHWVYIEGVVGNDIYMIDPASDTVLLYDKYQLYGGNEYWALTCKNPPAPFDPANSDPSDPIITQPDDATTTTTTITKSINTKSKTTTTTTETTTTTKPTTTTTSTTTTKPTTTTTTTKPTTTSTTSTTTKLTTTSTSTSTSTSKASSMTSTLSMSSTTTTTLSSSSKNTTTTTVSTSTVTTSMASGEYYNPEEKEIPIYDLPDMTGKPVAYVRMNEVVNVLECRETMGHIEGKDGFAGWIDLSGMNAVNDEKPHKRGDINGDGKVDMYDLGLLGEYLGSVADMPDGVSGFTSCEKNAADINGDGKVTDGDVLVCLLLVCN